MRDGKAFGGRIHSERDTRRSERAWVLLDDFDLIGMYGRYDGYMTVWVTSMTVEDDEIAGLGLMFAGMRELQKTAAFTEGAVAEQWVEKIFGIAVRIRHFMVVVLVIIALHKFHALVSNPDVVTVCCGVAFAGMAHAAIVVNLHAVEAVECLADLVPGIGIHLPE